MKKVSYMKALLAVGIVASAAAPAIAEGEWSGNVAIGSEYVWRGVTQSNGDIALSGGLDYANGMFYAGTWASNVDFEDGSDTNIELDLYGGLTSEFANGVSWDVGVVGYIYPDSETEDLDFIEIYGGLGYAFESGFELGGYVYVDPDNESFYTEATAAYALSDMFSIDGSIGNYGFDGGGDYVNFSLGATASLEMFDLDLRFWSNDIDAGGNPVTKDLLDDRVVFTISRSM